MVSTRLAPAVCSMSAMSRAVIGTRGWSFLSERAYEKYGTTAVMRLAEARLSASIMMSSSRIESLTFGIGRLDDEDVVLADVLVDLGEDVLVRELDDLGLAERHPEIATDGMRELGMRVPVKIDRSLYKIPPCS